MEKKSFFKNPIFRWTLISLLILLTGTAYFMGIRYCFSYHCLQQAHHFLKGYVETHPYLSVIMYIFSFFALTALSLPVSEVMGILGGFLFPFPWNMMYIILGATLGASVVFLAAKTTFGFFLKRKAGPKIERFEKGFKKNAWSYLLFLRFVPLFPFWLINLVPAFFSVHYKTFIWTTVVGLLPITYIHAQIGEGLNVLFKEKDHFSFHSLLNPHMEIALILLGVCSLIPVFFKKKTSHQK